MYTMGSRLREVRQHSGLSQAEFGAIGGVKKRAQINYENDARQPDGKYLDALALAGYDISYIITGTPNPAMARGLASALASVEEARARALAENARAAQQRHDVVYRELTLKEDQLVTCYRAADKRGKESILTTAAALSLGHSPSSAQPTHVSADRSGIAIAGGRDVHVGSPLRTSTRRRK
jgi:transcriptional regulator with XRE-family HTH domain